MKNFETRKLSASTSTQVVPLGTRWRDDEAWPAHLRKRAKATEDFFIAKSGVVVAGSLRVGFLAERIETACISVSDRYARWNILAVYVGDTVHRYAVRAAAWDKKPPLPGLDLSNHETDLIYQMCDELSRKQAYIEHVYEIDRQISLDLVSNVHRAKELGEFDENRFIALLTTDPLVLPVLEATLFAAVWSEAALENAPQFILNFILPSTQAATVREYVAEHFHAVDLLRSPAAPFSHPMTLRLEKTQEPIYAPAASGRLVLLNPVGDAISRLVNEIERRAHEQLLSGEAEDRPFAAFPITITTRALPSAYAYNVPVSADTHSLREEDADCLRLAAAELLRYVPDAARTLSDAIDDLACHPRAYRMSLPERWVILVRRFVRHFLLTSESARDTFDRISGEAERLHKEDELRRAETIDCSVAFLLDPERYKDAISPRPKTPEELQDVVAFIYAPQKVLAYNPDRFPGLLQRAGVGPELVTDVTQALKDRAIFTSENVKINVGGASRRFLSIPLSKFENSAIPSIPAGIKEVDSNVQ